MVQKAPAETVVVVLVMLRFWSVLLPPAASKTGQSPPCVRT